LRFIKAFLFGVIQWTWGLPQNLVGGAAYLRMRKKHKQERFHRGFVTYVRAKNFGGVSLGMFVFVNPDNKEAWVHDTRIHEYGHTMQSLLLGPLYLLVIGLPSMIWCNFAPVVKYRNAHGLTYYWLYCEGWANSWGERFSKEAFADPKKMKAKRFEVTPEIA